MSHRLNARRRLDLALQVIGLAFDQDGIPFDGAAATLGVDPGVIVDVIEPFTDLEYVHTSGSLLDDIGHVVAIDGDEIYVQSNWMQDLASLTPGDAALLLAMIETAGTIEGLNVEAVRSLRRSLDAITHVTVSDPVPPSVSQLLGAKHKGHVISARYEGADMRVAAEPSLYEVHEVRWTDSGWRALVTDYEDPDATERSLLAERLHDIHQTSHRFERRTLTMPEYVGTSRSEVVDIEYRAGQEWLLAYFNPEVVSESDGTAIARIRIDTDRTLARLLLRLGPDARIVEPQHLRGRGADAARRLLGRYQPV